MKKFVSVMIFIIFIGLGIGLYYVLENLDYIIKTAIEKYGSETTQTSVRVNNVKSNLINAEIAINGLTIANPRNFDFPHAFSMAGISTKVNIDSLKEEPFIIEEVVIQAPKVFFEMNNDKKINLDKLKNNLSQASASTAGNTLKQDKTKKAKSNSTGPKLIIRRVLFSGGNILVKITPLNNKEYNLKLPTLDIRNLGGKNGASADNIAREIVNRLIQQARKAIKEKGIDRELAKFRKKLKDKLDAEKAKLKAKVDAKKQHARDKIEAEKTKLKAKKAELKKKIEAEKAALKANNKAKLEAEKQKAKDKLKGLFN